MAKLWVAVKLQWPEFEETAGFFSSFDSTWLSLMHIPESWTAVLMGPEGWRHRRGGVGVLPERPLTPPFTSPHPGDRDRGSATLTHDQLWLSGKILLKHLYSYQIFPLFCSLETERRMRAIIQQHWGFFDVSGRSEILKCNFMLGTNTGLKICLWGVFYWLHLFSSHLQTFLLCLGEKKTTWMQTSS